MESLPKILSGLSWYQDKDFQEYAINYIVNDSSFDIHYLLQPLGKDCWENAAKAISLMKYDRISRITLELFEWLQDMNWPGAIIIRDLLMTFPKVDLILYFEQSTEIAVRTNDEMWLTWLSYFTFYGKFHKDDFTDKSLYEFLANFHDNWEDN